MISVYEFPTDEVMVEDLESAADFYDSLAAGELPQQKAVKFAKDTYGVDLNDALLNKILSRFACSTLTIEGCVNYHLQQGSFS